MNAIKFSVLRSVRALGSLTLALCGVHSLADPTAKQADAFPVFDSYIKITGKNPSVTGNPASFARRFQTPANGAYGLEALHYSKDLDKETAIEIDGRALSGAEDYLGQIKLTRNETGSFEIGYKRFRTFYDGIGGFFPRNNTWMPLGQEELHTDRAKFWADLNIARPGAPVFRLLYTNELRSGRKDTTIWGDTDFTGIPILSQSSLNPYSAARKIVASYIDLNERQEVLEASLRHTVGKTDLEIVVTNNRTDFLNTRYINRYPGELRPFPAIPASPVTVIPPALANNPNLGFDAAGSKARVMNYTGKFETKFSDRLSLFGGLNYQRSTADISGDREITLFLRTPFGVVSGVGGFTANGRPPYSYRTDFGNTKENIFTANLGFAYQPAQDLAVNLALKRERLEVSGVNQVTYINNLIAQATGVVTLMLVAAPNNSIRNETAWVPELEVRYTGIRNLALYGTFDYRDSPGDQSGLSTGVTVNAAPSEASMSDRIKVTQGHYKAGANWTISPQASVRAEMFYKNHLNRYTGFGDDEGVIFNLGYEFYGTKLTAIVKPAPTLTCTTRYVRQNGKMNTQTDVNDKYASLDSTNHLFGETIDWTPNNQVYVQANLNVVFATASTAYPRAGGTANDVLRNADNNYVSGSVVAGCVVGKATDAQLQYTWYRADNFNAAIVASQPYGAAVKEYTVTLALKHKFSDRIIANAKIGYYDSKNDTTGGFTNFKGPLAYVSLAYAL